MKTILVVEDDEKSRRLMKDVLMHKGYGVVTIASGDAALDMALRHRPHLILMDIQLPGISGVAALQELRFNEVTRDIPVIAVTASVLDPDRERIRLAGFDGFQTKPLNLPGFLKAVEEMLERGRQAP
jgi:two-component system, cell cycle response regulator DivK